MGDTGGGQVSQSTVVPTCPCERQHPRGHRHAMPQCSVLPWGQENRRYPTHVLELPERDELDYVTEDGLALGGAQDAVVPIQDLHVGEVGVAHPHDDDGHGKVGGADDGLPCVRHVRHHSVRQDQQDEVLLGDTHGCFGRGGAAWPHCRPQAGGAGQGVRSDVGAATSGMSVPGLSPAFSPLTRGSGYLPKPPLSAPRWLPHEPPWR